MAASTATSRSRARRTPRSVLWGTPSRPGRTTLPRVEHPPSTQTWGALGGGSGPACRPPPPNPCLLRRANRAAYLQWSTILAKLQGGGQGADHHIPPQLVLAALATHSHIHSHAVGHSAQPDVLQKQSRGLASAPPPHAPSARLQPYPLHCSYPSSPTLTSNLMACSSGFRGARPLLGGWGGGRKRKPGSVKPGAPSPRTLRFPVTHPRRPRTTYSGKRHLCCSGSCPSHCGAQVRAVSPGILLWPPQPPEPSVGWGWNSGDWCGLPPSWQVPTQQLPAPAHPVLHCPDPIME